MGSSSSRSSSTDLRTGKETTNFVGLVESSRLRISCIMMPVSLNPQRCAIRITEPESTNYRFGVGSPVFGLSGLTKKTIYTDKLLATVLGVSEGDRVSYADLTRGLHKYIKDHGLKSPQTVAAMPAPAQLAASGPPDILTVASPATAKTCRDCGAEIPADAVFCDLCGARQ